MIVKLVRRRYNLKTRTPSPVHAGEKCCLQWCAPGSVSPPEQAAAAQQALGGFQMQYQTMLERCLAHAGAAAAHEPLINMVNLCPWQPLHIPSAMNIDRHQGLAQAAPLTSIHWAYPLILRTSIHHAYPLILWTALSRLAEAQETNLARRGTAGRPAGAAGTAGRGRRSGGQPPPAPGHAAGPTSAPAARSSAAAAGHMRGEGLARHGSALILSRLARMWWSVGCSFFGQVVLDLFRSARGGPSPVTMLRFLQRGQQA